MRLSILILTHKRPKLFERCLLSALFNLPADVEIIVNNDSNDIEEIKHKQVTYYYNNFENLSDIYKFLFNRAKGDYIYFLEDDDYLVENFYDIIQHLLNVDILAGNYYPKWNTTQILKCSRIYNNSNSIILDKELLQLGQFIFKRQLLDTFIFPNDSHIHNDYKLIEYVLNRSNSKKTISNILYYQTTDGNDNISFPESSNYYGL